MGTETGRPVPATAGSGSEAVPVPQASEPAQQVATAGNRIELSLVGDVQELSDERLATLVGEMDRIEAIPAEEPEALTPVVGDSESIGGN